MKETQILPTFWGTYVVIGLDVVKLTPLVGCFGVLNSEIKIDRYYLSQIVKAAAAETAEELIEIIPECNVIPNWVELVKILKNSISGKVVTGLWKSANVFITDNETLEVLPTSGVFDLLEKFKNTFPRRSRVIIMDVIYSDGTSHKVIPWTFSY
jgi:hypothetical protein